MIDPTIRKGIWYDLYRVRTALLDLRDALSAAELRASDRLVLWALAHGTRQYGAFRSPLQEPLGAPGGTEGPETPALEASE